MGINIIKTTLLSRELSLQLFGTYSQTLLIVSIGTSISILGLSDAINDHGYRVTKWRKLLFGDWDSVK